MLMTIILAHVGLVTLVLGSHGVCFGERTALRAIGSQPRVDKVWKEQKKDREYGENP